MEILDARTARLDDGRVHLHAGPLGEFSITNFSRNEPLEEGVTVSVTAKLAVFDEWIEDGLEAA